MSAPTAPPPPGLRAPALQHVAFCYRSEEHYLRGVRSFLQPALDEGSPVLVAVPGDRLRLLREALPSADGLISFEDLAVAGRNPGRIIPGVLLPFAEEHPDRRVWVIGESVWARRHPESYSACIVHEALVNLVLAHRDVVLLCAYDTRTLAAGLVRGVLRTHPALHQGDERRTSRVYADPAETAAGSSPPIPAPPAHATCVDVVDERDLTPLRQVVGRQAVDAGLSGRAVQAVVLAVNELAANTIEHTGGPGRLSVWTDGDELLCQIDDSGHITDPPAGRVPAAWDPEGGRGLLLIHDLCDLVLIHSTSQGTTIRVHFALPSPDGDLADGADPA